MNSKTWIIVLVILLLGSNAFWLYVVVDEGISYTYLESSYERSEKMLTQTTRLANMGLIGLPADDAISRMSEGAESLTIFEKEGCIFASNVCVRLNENRVVTRIETDYP